MTRKSSSDPAATVEKKSLLIPIVIAASAMLHIGVLAYAAAQPAPAKPVDPTARVQVLQYQHDEASDAWTGSARRWARVSRDKLALASQ